MSVEYYTLFISFGKFHKFLNTEQSVETLLYYFGLIACMGISKNFRKNNFRTLINYLEGLSRGNSSRRTP